MSKKKSQVPVTASAIPGSNGEARIRRCFMCERLLIGGATIGEAFCSDPCHRFAQGQYLDYLGRPDKGKLTATTLGFQVLLGWRKIPFKLDVLTRAADLWGVRLTRLQTKAQVELLIDEDIIELRPFALEDRYLMTQWRCESMPSFSEQRA